MRIVTTSQVWSEITLLMAIKAQTTANLTAVAILIASHPMIFLSESV